MTHITLRDHRDLRISRKMLSSNFNLDRYMFKLLNLAIFDGYMYLFS